MDVLVKTKALADETRLRLLGVLSRHELNVGEIVQVMGMGQSRISRHLKILMDAGLVTCQRNGVWAFYSTAQSDSGPLLVAVLEELASVPEYMADLKTAARVQQERRHDTARFFDEIASDWKRLSREILGDFDLSGCILERLRERGVVADLGCGPGLLLERLVSRAQTVIGVDNSSRMLDAAARLLPNRAEVSLRIGDLEHLPLRDGEADAAVMSMVLHHLASPQAGVAEMGRVVRSGGQVILADFLPHANETMRSRYGDRWLGFPEEGLCEWLLRFGFTTESCERVPVNMGLTLALITARRLEREC